MDVHEKIFPEKIQSTVSWQTISPPPHLLLKLMFCNFLFQQKISSGFSWPADQSTAINNYSSASKTTATSASPSSEKGKIKKPDLGTKSSPKTPATHPESSFSASPINLDTMPVSGAVQGQNPTQGKWNLYILVSIHKILLFPSLQDSSIG